LEVGLIARLATRAKRVRSTSVSKCLVLRSSPMADAIPKRSQIASIRYAAPNGFDEIKDISGFAASRAFAGLQEPRDAFYQPGERVTIEPILSSEGVDDIGLGLAFFVSLVVCKL